MWSLQLWQQHGRISNFLGKMLHTHQIHKQENCDLQRPMQQNEDSRPHPWKYPSFLCDSKEKPSTAAIVIGWNGKEHFCEEITGKFQLVKLPRVHCKSAK